MAKVRFSPGVRSFRGSVGDLVYRRHGRGTIVYKKTASSGSPKSEGTKAQNEKFKEGVAYAKLVREDAELAPFYREAARRAKRIAFRVAQSDYMRPPKIDEVDLTEYVGEVGDVITIKASDDRHVAGVYVRLGDGEGQVFEEGEPELDRGVRWLYRATVPVAAGSVIRVEVTAMDIPGGTHTLVLEVEVQDKKAPPGLPKSVQAGTRIVPAANILVSMRRCAGVEALQRRETGRGTAEQDAAGRDAADLGVAGQGIAELDVAGLDVADLEVAGLEVAGPDVAEPDAAGLDAANLSKPDRVAAGIGSNAWSPTAPPAAEQDDLATLSRVRELVNGRHIASPNVPNLNGGVALEHVRIALELLHVAERLLRIGS